MPAEFTQNPHAQAESAYFLIDTVKLPLHLKYFGVYHFFYRVVGRIMNDVPDLGYTASGLSHCGDKEKGADLGSGIIVIAVGLVDFGYQYVLLIIVS